MGISMKKASFDAQKLVIFTNAILLVVGTGIQSVEGSGRDIIMSVLFTVWIGTFIWYMMAQRESAF